MSPQILLFIILVSIDFFLFMPYENLGVNRIISSIIIVYLVFLLIFKRTEEDSLNNAFFKKEVALMAILPLVSAFSCFLYRGQPIMISLMAARFSLYWLLYYCLHKYQIPSSSIIKVLFSIAVVSSLIYVLQQITYPTIYLFNSLQSFDDVEIRQGFYRFRLFPLNPYIFFAFYFYLCKFIENRERQYLFFLLLFVIGIYLTLTRQLYFCIFLPVVFYPIFRDNNLGRKKLFGLISSLVLLFLVYSNIGLLFGNEFVEMTEDEGNEDNIRVLAYTFYGLEYWVDNFNMIFGNGVASWGNSEYGDEILSIEEVEGLYRSDIGIVGNFNTFGIVYVIAVLFIYIKFFKNYNYIPICYRLLIIASIINLPLACWMDWGLFMAIIFYLIDQEIIKQKQLYEEEYESVSNRS